MITKEEFKKYCITHNLRYEFDVDGENISEELLDFLESNWNNNNLFSVLCYYGYIETLKWLWTLGEINIHTNDEEAFIRSCSNGKIEVAKWLIEISKENGEEINIHRNKEKAFIWSCLYGQIEIAKWLMKISEENGEMINIHTCNNGAFTLSCIFGNIEVAKWLCSLCDEYYIEIKDDKIVKSGITKTFDKYLDEKKGIKKVIKRLQLKVI